MYVDWEYYKIFYYVAKYQNFTRAARVLGNNQPNITHAMNRLESQLNCVLFIRSNRLRISNHSTPQAVQAVRNGEVDFAIVTTPAEVENGLKMVELMPFYEVLVGGKTFTALASQTLSLKELAGYPLICLNEESMTRSFYRQFFLEHDAVLKPDTEAATTDQMLTLVKSELGLAFMPEPMAAPLLASGELVQLHLQEIIPSRSICLVYDHHRPLNTAARKFQQLLTKAGTRSAERK